MIDKPEITQTTAQHTAAIHMIVARERIREVMRPGLDELMKAVARQGASPAGPWFTHHLRAPGADFDFEIGVPVTTPVTAAGRVKPSLLPAATVARTVYRGPYEGLGAAWAQFNTWVSASGRTPTQRLRECYVAGPESGGDPSAWRTELIRPLVD